MAEPLIDFEEDGEVSEGERGMVMYQSNRSFNIQPRAFEFLENFCSNSPLPGPKICSNAPTLVKITRLLL